MRTTLAVVLAVGAWTAGCGGEPASAPDEPAVNPLYAPSRLHTERGDGVGGAQSHPEEHAAGQADGAKDLG